ncbi:hypothetical protein [Planotetraspora sp. GP83]|uniref:hypothetical protein n=1 Tax=Planotetraspora sp. GP83 TaxID=3156264 RepID=UPI003511165D
MPRTSTQQNPAAQPSTPQDARAQDSATQGTPFAFTPVTPPRSKASSPSGFGAAPSTAFAPGQGGGGPQENLPVLLPQSTPPDAPRGTAKKVLLAACAVVVVGAIGTAAYYAYTDKPTNAALSGTPSATNAPDATSAAQPTPMATAVLDSEATDPRKLTLAEAFPDSRVTLDGRTFKRVKVDMTDDCADAAAGVFAEALKQQQCRRVLRATYVDGKRDYAVTTGIAVLPTKDAALTVDQRKDLNGNLWFRGLNGNAASGADRVAISGGYAAGMVWGRYIIFSYATYADGHTPDAKDKNLGPVSGAFRDQTAQVIEKRVTS